MPAIKNFEKNKGKKDDTNVSPPKDDGKLSSPESTEAGSGPSMTGSSLGGMLGKIGLAGFGSAKEKRKQVSTSEINDAPLLDLNGEADGTSTTTSYSTGSPLTKIAPSALVSDVDSSN